MRRRQGQEEGEGREPLRPALRQSVTRCGAAVGSGGVGKGGCMEKECCVAGSI